MKKWNKKMVISYLVSKRLSLNLSQIELAQRYNTVFRPVDPLNQCQIAQFETRGAPAINIFLRMMKIKNRTEVDETPVHPWKKLKEARENLRLTHEEFSKLYQKKYGQKIGKQRIAAYERADETPGCVRFIQMVLLGGLKPFEGH